MLLLLWLVLHEFCFWVAFFDFSFDEFDAPDADAAEFDFPVGVAEDGFEASDVAFQGRGVHETAELIEDLRDSVVWFCQFRYQ